MRTASLSHLKVGLLLILGAAGCDRASPTASGTPGPVPATASALPATALPPATATATAPATATASASATALASAPAPHHATALRVDRLVIARGVESREPVGTDTVFASSEKRLFAFVDVDNPEHAPGDLHVQFVGPGGETQPPIELSVGESPRWRTWAFTRHARAPGTWKAVVRDERGHVLASTEFAVRG
jgi:hypothetical protein